MVFEYGRVRRIAVLLLMCLVLNDQPVRGQAYCALRDPTRKIYAYFPDATSYKSLVRTVDENVRQQIANRLPFTIHFNELGRHTLYLPVAGGRPLGLIHARSEASDWGLTEIVWSLSPDMTVNDFSFQRCRSRRKTSIESEAFKRQVVGKSFSELRALLTDDGEQLASDGLEVKQDASNLALAVVRSALKTMLVTELVWERDLAVIRPLYLGQREFEDAARVEKISQPYNEKVRQRLAQELGDDKAKGQSVERSKVVLLRVKSRRGNTVGYLVKTPWKSLGQEAEIWWSVRDDLVVENVFAEQGWSDAETRKAFEAVKGLAIDRLGDCSTAADLIGAEVLLLVRNN